MLKNLNNQQKDSLIPFFLLTFLITWGLGALAIFLPAQFQALFGELKDTSPIYFFAIAAPSISATILAFVQDGWNGLRSLYARLIRWRFDIRWYALILIGIPLTGWIATLITESNPLREAGNPSQFLRLLVFVLITGPLCEELGWRGFALPRLLNRFSPFTASLILGVIWGVWHLPSFFLSGMVQKEMSVVLFVIYTPCLSILMSWVFQHTHGSVLSSVMIHYTVNICTAILGVTLPVLGIILLMASVFILVFDKPFGWFQPQSFDRPVFSVGETK